LHGSNDNYGIIESIFYICKGQTSKIDLSIYETIFQQKKYIAFLSFNYGFISDVDLESEVLRWLPLGSTRIDVWAFWRILSLRTFRAKFSFLPPSQAISKIPSIQDSVPSHWKTIEDEFILCSSNQTSHSSHNCFISPCSKLNDGLFKILLIRSTCSRLKLIHILLQLESGTHILNKEAEIYDCIAYRFEVIHGKSYNNLDGELIESGNIQGYALPSSMNIFSGITKD